MAICLGFEQIWRSTRAKSSWPWTCAA